jgi:hypothetical protein
MSLGAFDTYRKKDLERSSFIEKWYEMPSIGHE